ncbi:hypothetical protein GEV33_007214 [Tenebrio molitor]|uniref:Ig-like domain-containing protein n=1 Tax=Tenebrio molitor TaxID=7067 RepID=A0A8J6HJP0_TENMO|nr:hypothetical protein GEV33_007214 [Tenebrio molitor]
MDNAPYHSVRSDKRITSTSNNEDMRAWLQNKNIEFDKSLIKKQLLALIKPLIDQEKKSYIVDTLLHSHGYDVLRLPPYNCQYNPIELAWAFTKSYYNKHINEEQAKSPNTVRRVWEEALLHFTPDILLAIFLQSLYLLWNLTLQVNLNGGIYRCTASNAGGEASAELRLVVSTALHVEISPAMLNVHMGGSAEFRCIVSAPGDGPHLVTWYKDGRQLPSTGRGSSETLVVNNVGREDRGMYQCIVRRAEGDTAQAAAELQLGGKKTRQVHSVTVSPRRTPSNTESVCSGDNFGAAQRGVRRRTSEEVTRQPDPEIVVTRNTCQARNQPADGEPSAQPQVEAPTQLPTGPLVDMEALVQVLSRLVAPRSTEPPIFPEFSGLEHEDPERFLEKCRERLAATDPESWRDRVATRLRDLERGLIEKYGGLDKVVRLHAEFYGTRQAKEEPTETFLQKKKLLAARILPTMTEKVLVATCRTLLRDELVMYSKKDGQPRFCVDYRRLNAATRDEAAPLPIIQEMLRDLGQAKVFSSLDLKSGYWQVPLSDESKEYTAFTTPDGGLYQFRVMPFGLKGAPPTFQRLMSQEMTSSCTRPIMRSTLNTSSSCSNGSKSTACDALRKNVTSESEKSSTWDTSFPLKATSLNSYI